VGGADRAAVDKRGRLPADADADRGAVEPVMIEGARS